MLFCHQIIIPIAFILETGAQTAFDKLSQKHVDFLLCETERIKPASGVEVVRKTAKEDTRNTNNYREWLIKWANEIFEMGRISRKSLLVKLSTVERVNEQANGTLKRVGATRKATRCSC